MADAGSRDPGKLSTEVTVSIRGSLNEVAATVMDLTATGMDVFSTGRLPPNERVGMTIRCSAVSGPGVAVSGEVQRIRDKPSGGYFIHIEFVHSGDSERWIQSFLWSLEEVRQKKRGR
ncbi:MAG TPA: PilZ domain-containing protein [Planctomycetota bacterium]|jgi:PilZ domain-containing protein|nr:PilZ domain-containing protein [Planctomycetota bacterium]